MSYVLTNGHTYITKKPNNKFTVTYDPGLAVQFDSENKAWNVLKSLPNAYRGQGYLPKGAEVKETKASLKDPGISKVESPRQKLAPVSYPVEDSVWMAEFKSRLKIVDETLGTLKTMYAGLYSDLNRATDEIDDLEHAIEFIRANAVKRCYLENELKRARKIRRECKDAMGLIEMILKFDLDDWGTGKVTSAIVHLENRCYAPKVREDIFT